MDLFFILLIVNLIKDSIGTYFLFPENVNFVQAVQKCSSINATVLFIDDLAEDTYIKNTFLNDSLVSTAIWLAIYDIFGNEANVNYYTNQTLNYTNWSIDNPSQKCFRYVKDGNWWDGNCGSVYSTLCEFSTIQTSILVTNVFATITIPANIMNIPVWNTRNPWSFCEFHRQRNNNKMTNGIENEILNVSCSLVCEWFVFI
jgi:hypothetical protein